ncbi:hypothetical protein L3Q82_004841 [Scortum barcoo]|uniref:Uncharacterized protein n=1 Tax=Scortum barcoo TaxID=214431 RepID=A0ACB8VDM7_9TELE|nr:hypothetical protein L3Q82_004841 [Scortum barcoo]
MPRSKEIPEELRKKVIEIHQSGKGYKAISKAVGIQRTTVRAIIHKWRKLGTVANLPRSGRPPKITPRVRRRLIQEVTKDPQKTSKELQASLASVKFAALSRQRTFVICPETGRSPLLCEILASGFLCVIISTTVHRINLTPEEVQRRV